MNNVNFLNSWSGRIILINTLVFINICFMDMSIFNPSYDVLMFFGAKDPVKLGIGEYWRFLTPVFIHIGIIHFLFNTYALYYIGNNIESIIGGVWFLLIYIISGISGNIFSSVFNMSVSAGASGAIFGLIGVGFYIENILSKKKKNIYINQTPRIYRSLVIINIIFGLIIPAIDNASHMGGFLAGMSMIYAVLFIKSNRLVKLNVSKGYKIIFVIILILFGFSIIGSNPKYINYRLNVLADSSKSNFKKSYYYDRIIELNPNNYKVIFKRARLFILSGNIDKGLIYLRKSLKDNSLISDFKKLIKELKENNNLYESWQIERMLEYHIKHMKKSLI